MEFFSKFTDFIFAIVNYIQSLVKYIRAKNDGDNNAVAPEFPDLFGGGEPAAEQGE